MKTDPTAFYSYDEYETAAHMLYDTVMLRAESIRGQLDGSIPSTDNGQREDTSALIDASEIDVKVMGQFSMGGFGGQRDKTVAESSAEESEASVPDARPNTGTPPDMQSADATDETASTASDPSTQEESISETALSASIHRQRPPFAGMSEQASGQAKSRNLIIFGACFVVMLIALILVKLYKRNRV